MLLLPSHPGSQARDLLPQRPHLALQFQPLHLTVPQGEVCAGGDVAALASVVLGSLLPAAARDTRRSGPGVTHLRLSADLASASFARACSSSTKGRPALRVTSPPAIKLRSAHLRAGACRAGQ
jgi:hypothetical protein